MASSHLATGTLHGGMTATLVDQLSTLALKSAYEDPAGPPLPSQTSSVELSVSYLAAVKVGDDILIQANTIKRGRTLAFLSVDITNKSTGKIVATGKHTKYLTK